MTLLTDFELHVITKLDDLGQRMSAIETIAETQKDTRSRLMSLERSRDKALGMIAVATLAVGVAVDYVKTKFFS